MIYSTLLGATGRDVATAVAVDASGVVTVGGWTNSRQFPTTAGAFDTTYNGGTTDSFVSRLDLSRSGPAQLNYSSYLGGGDHDYLLALAADATGAVTVGGYTKSLDLPVTASAFTRFYRGGVNDGFVTRFDMLPTGVSAYGSSSPGCTGPLAIGVTSMPQVGNSAFSVTCNNAPPNTSRWLIGSAASLATPWPVFGTQLWVDPNSGFVVTGSAQSDALGAADFSIPIPNHPTLAG